jgi:multicomponent K+:H+ antiporter subunit A
VLLLARAAGSTDLDAVLAAGDRVRASPLYLPALLLVLLGAFTKSAQWPFHFWLPRAMAAPTPASAYLHSATMVKAGVFLLARLHPVLAGTDLWLALVGGAGMATLLFGAYAALWQHDLKGLLAYSTISHLGLITMLLGFGTGTALAAAVFHVVNHATFKASLFMAAGIVDHEAGTRDMRVLNGLARAMPYTAALAAVAAAAMAGVPLLNGFLSKEMFFEAALHTPRTFGIGGVRLLEPAAALLFGVLSVAYSARFVMEVFFNADGNVMPRAAHEPPRFMRVPVELLVGLCVLVGVAPAAVVGRALRAATRDALQGPPPDVSLALWHGFNLPLAMTVLALAGGAVVYRRREALYAWYARLPHLDAAALYDRVESGAARAAGAATRGSRPARCSARPRCCSPPRARSARRGPGRGARGRAGRAAPVAGPPLAGPPADAASVAVWALLLVSAVVTARWHRRRLAALIGTSAVGLFVALAFAGLSAPDLAVTQLLVEVVTILVLLLALHHLPAESPRESSPARRARDLGLAGAVGLGAAALAWAVLRRPVYGGRAVSDVADYYLRRSKPAGGGTNAVNVILVDFRGLDTLGEIAVLACAGLGAAVLLERMRPLPADPARPFDADRHPVVLAMLARPFLPLALVLAAFLFVRGHDLPGGGFAAGLLAAVALASQYLTSGIAWTSARLRLDARRWLAAGVLLALATGLGALAFGRPFLTSFYRYVPVPLVGKVGVGSATLFDLGVLAAVFGAVLLALERLGLVGRARHAGTATPADDDGAHDAAAPGGGAPAGRARGRGGGRGGARGGGAVNALLASAVGVLAACGAYLVLRARTWPVVLGLMLLGYAANLLLIAMGPPARRGAAGAPHAAPRARAVRRPGPAGPRADGHRDRLRHERVRRGARHPRPRRHGHRPRRRHGRRARRRARRRRGRGRMSDAWLLAPVLVPLATAMALVPLAARRGLVRALALASTGAQLAVAALLVRAAAGGGVLVHRFGDWPVPQGIVFVLDRLSALMLFVTAALALPALAHAVRGDDAEGSHFHSFFQLQLAGLAGAFLTGDLFTLFVFFEVLLIASYALLVHGATPARLRWGVHYVALNLVGSTFFLAAAGAMYGLLGTLNLAELARRVALLPAADAGPVRAAALLLLVVFALKAAVAPLHLWLGGAYAAAAPAVAALFAVMSKVGIYAVLRVFGVAFGDGAGALAGLAAPWLFPAALATAALGAVAAFGARVAPGPGRPRRRGRRRPRPDARRPAAGGVAARHVGGHARRGGRAAARRGRGGGAVLPRAQHARRRRALPRARPRRAAGRRARAAFAVAAVAVAGLPPLAGFVGKAMILAAAPAGAAGAWLWAAVLGSSFLAVVALARTGATLFWEARAAWAPALDGSAPAGAAVAGPGLGRRAAALAPAGVLLASIAALTAAAGPVGVFTADAARQLLAPGGYSAAVLATPGGRR